MTIFFVVVTFVAVVVRDGMSDPTISAFFKGETETHWLVWAITKGLSFAGGVYIILSGVRLIIGEIVPAFRGIAEHLSYQELFLISSVEQQQEFLQMQKVD